MEEGNIMINLTQTIEVTQEDIDKGERRQCNTCPVALAITRQLPEELKGCVVSVTCLNATIFSKNTRGILRHAELPEEAADFIQRFDDHIGVQPFTFSLTWWL
jgi:hypothetical protein